MRKVKLPPPTTSQILTWTQQLTNTHLFPELVPASSIDTSTIKELLEEHKASVDKLSVPFSIYQNQAAKAKPKPVRWLWQKRLPLAGITLLDGDLDCGKSLLALQIAAAVSSGTPMPDGTPTIQGGVVIVTPNVDATTSQLQLLTALGADLSRIAFLSFIKQSAPEFHTGGYRPFSLPEDFLPLFQAIKHVDARLVIFDPFVHLISREHRCTNQDLAYLLMDLNQRLIERNVACLLVRNCGAKGKQARPSALEQSDHFSTIAVSRLLLAPDPIQPDRLLLSHAKNRHTALTPTLTFQIQPMPENPDLSHIRVLGSHNLRACDLLAHRPEALHRQYLSHHLLALITSSPDPVPVATLYAHCPHSSIFQIQRTLSDLLRMGQIEHPARGFYASATTDPAFPQNATGTATSTPEPMDILNTTGTTTPTPEPMDILNTTGTTTPTTEPTDLLNTTGTTTPTPEPMDMLNGIGATTPTPEPMDMLNGTGATTLTPEPMDMLSATGATILTPELMTMLSATDTTILTPELMDRLSATGAIILTPEPMDMLNATDAITPLPELTRILNVTDPTTLIPEPMDRLNVTDAIIPTPELMDRLNGTGATIPISEPMDRLNGTDAITLTPELTARLNGTGATNLLGS